MYFNFLFYITCFLVRHLFLIFKYHIIKTVDKNDKNFIENLII